MIRLPSSCIVALVLTLLGASFVSPAIAAKEAAKEPVNVTAPAQNTSLDDLLGQPNERYVPQNLIDEVGRYDYRGITTLPSFERYSSRGRWNGNSAGMLLGLLNNFHGVRGSTSLRTMWRNILLGEFTGLTIDGDANAQQVALFTERLKVLNALGFFDEAARLYQMADNDENPIPESVAEQGIEAMALTGSADAACLEVNLALGSLRSDNWLQDGAMCAAYFGQTTKADKLFDAAEKNGGDGFRTVYRMLRDNKMSGSIAVNMPPLWRTLLLAKGATVGIDSLKKLSPADQAAIAINAHVPYGLRLAAGERAALAGSISSDQLRKLYDEQGKPSDAELASMVQQIKAGTVLSRPRMYQAARFTFAGNDRALIVEKAIKSLPNANSALGGVYHWIIVKLTLQKDKIAWFAPTGYVVLIGGNRGDAKYYYEYGALENHYVSFLRLFDDNKYATPEFFIKWRKDIAKTFPKDGLWRIDTGMAIARMLGVSDEITTDSSVVFDASPVSASITGINDSISNLNADPVWQSFQQAVSAKERGNGVVAALNLYADRPWRKFDPSFFNMIFTGLNKIGARNENVKISVEIAMQTVI